MTAFDGAPGPIRVSGHFGEWLQGRLGQSGPVALVTVACDALGAGARRLDVGAFGIAEGELAGAAALLSQLGAPFGRFSLTIEAPAGGGAGMSTAALVALARAAGAEAGARALAQACLAVEGAVDPLMFAAPDRRLWAPRRAETLRPVPPPPAAEIVGGFFGPAFRTDPQDQDFPDIGDLIPDWVAAAEMQDLAKTARLAAVSANRTTARRGPSKDPTPRLAQDLGALGWLRAHTGSARGLIFPPGRAPQEAERALEAAGLAQTLRFQTSA